METIGLVTQAAYVLRTRQVYVDVALQPRLVTETVPDGGVGGAGAMPAGARKPLASFLAPGSVLAVLGAAGSGKTTLVRYTALEMAERRWWPWQAEFWRPRRIPVLLYLRDHAEAILAEPRQNLGAIGAAAPGLEGAVTGPWLQRRLERGRCVVLLDGLDEVADARQRAAVVGWVNP
jgi:predicted NACHT family NTPase